MSSLIRACHHCIFSLSVITLLSSFYIQYGLKLSACPLCEMQRLCVALITLTTAFSIVVPRIRHKKMYWLIQLTWIGAGLYFVFRQLWLQSLPAGTAPACMPSLEMLWSYFPWTMLIKALIWGGGSCAVVDFRLLGWSLASWSALYFILIAFLMGIAFRMRNR